MDAVRIDRHAAVRVVFGAAIEQPPEWQAGTARGEIPQRDVDAGDGLGEGPGLARLQREDARCIGEAAPLQRRRSEEHTSELQSLMRISYAVFCMKKKTRNK